MKKFTLLCLIAFAVLGCSKDEDYLWIEWPERQFFNFGETVSFEYISDGYILAVEEKPEQWEVVLGSNKVSITAPGETGEEAEHSGKVVLKAVNGSKTLTPSLEVNSGTRVTFENVPAISLAGPTSKGDNLYSEYGEGQFISYSDANIGMSFGLNYSSYIWEEVEYGSYEFWNGGIAISNWNDMQTEGYDNQCSVYYSAPNGKGGRNGSSNFLVGNGYSLGWSGADGCGNIRFDSPVVIDHIWVMNTTYCAHVIQKGNEFASALTYDNKGWFKLIVNGYNNSGSKTGSKEVYLADFRTSDSPGLMKEWTMLELDGLGAVTRLEFDMDSSDDIIDEGSREINTPAYYCIDDIAVRK